MEIPPEELTISIVCSRYPRDLFRHLSQTYGVKIENMYQGILYVTGLMFPLQVILAGKLPEEEYVWLSRLRKNLSVERDIEPLARAYKGKDKNPLYSAAMDLIIRANKNQYEEGLKMCEALRELFEDEIVKRESLALERGQELGLKHGQELGLKHGQELGLIQGIGKGKASAILEVLGDLGPIPESLQNTIMKQNDLSKLSVWLKLAVKAGCMEDFIKGIAISAEGNKVQ